MKYGQENVRALNDELRTKLRGGAAVMTPGVAALGAEAVNRAIQAISVFDDFCQDNDPHQEHDFGAIEIEGQTVFFKIDCYSTDLLSGSDDPSDPSVTRRVMTIMLASEY
jgi:stage V sporulation protein SpoVS